MQMEGVRLVVNKGLSNHFQVSWLTIFWNLNTVTCFGLGFPWDHACLPFVAMIIMQILNAQCVVLCYLLKVNHTVLLSTLGDSSYRFGATYVGAKQMGPAEVHCSSVRFPMFSLCWTFCHAVVFLLSFSPSWWETWTTAAAWTPKSSTRSVAEFDPSWLFR